MSDADDRPLVVHAATWLLKSPCKDCSRDQFAAAVQETRQQIRKDKPGLALGETSIEEGVEWSDDSSYWYAVIRGYEVRQ